MTIICWGNLAKSADDTTRIEESIQDYIEDHDANPNAHMGYDYALGVHRLQAVLDHAVGSVGLQFMPLDKRYAMSMFESLDGWTTHGSVFAGIFGAAIVSTGGDVANKSWITASPRTGSPALDFSKNPYFQTTVRISSITDQVFYIGTSAQFEEVEHHGFGFHIVDTTLYAYWRGSGGVHNQAISGISINDFNCYRAYMDSDAGKIYFYVNGELKYTAETDLPSDNSPVYFQYYVEQTGEEARTIYPVDFIFQQDR